MSLYKISLFPRWVQHRTANEDITFHHDKDEGMASLKSTMRFPEVRICRISCKKCICCLYIFIPQEIMNIHLNYFAVRHSDLSHGNGRSNLAIQSNYTGWESRHSGEGFSFVVFNMELISDFKIP